MDINYDRLSLEELRDINARSAIAIANFEIKRQREALAKATEIAKSAGFSSLEELLESQSSRRVPIKKKYKHPDVPNLTWSGRGRKPRWFVDALNSGRTPDELRI